jgi:hypothetical protein
MTAGEGGGRRESIQTAASKLASAWDPLCLHVELARVTVIRSRFRCRRTIDRIRSPRRIVATSLAIGFFVLYLVNGIFVLSARQPADPEQLRWWLSGGMVLYAIYHAVRCAWSAELLDLELSAAERLWLGGAPIKRSSLTVYHVGNMIVPGMLKTFLLAVVLFRDVAHLELLVVGIFTSLVLLEIVRLMIARWSAGLDPVERRRFRVAVTLVALAVGIQWTARVLTATPLQSQTWVYILNGFRSLGGVAACPAVQALSAAWMAAAQLAVSERYGAITMVYLLSSVATLPLAILALVWVDAWSLGRQHQCECRCLAAGDYRVTSQARPILPRKHAGRLRAELDRLAPARAAETAAVILRQWASVRRYWGTIVFSFAVPTLLCLSPLAIGRASEQWFYVVGGIAMCTMLLAPPALRIDFRRDLTRMILLRLLPLPPLSMVVGQLWLPVMITWIYQWLTLAIAAAVVQPPWSQLMLWCGLLNALAVFTFAAENALFLAYPYHQRSEGIAMLVRAKLTFLGKSSVLILAVGMLAAWAMLCRSWLPAAWMIPTYVTGAVLVAWSSAAAAVAAATACWRRFDFASDTPPE